MAIKLLLVADESLKCGHSTIIYTVGRDFPFYFTYTTYLQIKSVSCSDELCPITFVIWNGKWRFSATRMKTGNILTDVKSSHSISFSDISAFYRSREFGQVSLQPSERNCTTPSCLSGGRRPPHTMSATDDWVNKAFQHSIFKMILSVHTSKLSKPLMLIFSPEMESLSLWALTFLLPREPWVGSDKMHIATKCCGRRNIQTFTFCLSTFGRKNNSSIISNLSAETARIFFLNLYGFQLERHLHFMFRT